MTIRLLRTLVAIADAKTFSAAADVVHVTHAAVSQQMQTLESDLGVALFNRDTRTPELTSIGHQVVAKARTLIEDYDNLVPSIQAEGGLSGQIALGAIPTTLTGLTPQALAVLRSRFPQIGLRIQPGLTGSLLADVERGSLDLAIVAKPILVPVGLVFRELVQEPMQLIAAEEDIEDDPIKLLKERPFIRFNRSAVVGTLIDNWLLSRRLRVVATMELDSLETIESMVNANLGVSIVPDLSVSPQVSLPVKRVALGSDAPKRILGIVFREEQANIPVIDEVYSALAEVLRAARPDRVLITT